ncbi:MAG: queuosine precursor transporter [Candidatus Moranbacteria bacterium]|nr:queuosine precursor transporter [Candidatus Moranbacteria bacterium]
MFKINKLDFLISIYIFCIIVSELMGSKTFSLIGNFNASVAIFLMPFIFTINDVITEAYGKERTKSIIKSGLIMIIFLIAFSFLAINLPSSQRFASNQSAYQNIFGASIRISIASLLAFFVAEYMDVFIFVKIRNMMGKKSLWLRNNVSNFVAQFFDTSIFYLFAFYSLDKSFSSNIIFLVGLIIPYWALKCLVSVLETPLVYAGVKWLKKSNQTIEKVTIAA